MTSYFQDGSRDVTLRGKVVPSGECPRSVRSHQPHGCAIPDLWKFRRFACSQNVL